MKNILCCILSMIIFSNSFAGIKDETETLNSESIKRIEKVVEKIESSQKIKLYVNIFDSSLKRLLSLLIYFPYSSLLKN